ncbi:MAG: hypothetical protein PHE43_04075 [Candidatus Nanoarchaeia archaeon]|nr:hypothetical protein [Candidatus Nanoarchaeia archaeon]
MDMLVYQGMFGFFGGLVRSLIGILKYLKTKKGKKRIDWVYLILTLIASALMGAFSSIIISGDYRVSLASGYLGIDIIEDLFKIILKKQHLYRE